VKRADARRLLETIRDRGYDRPNARPLVRSPGFDSLYNEDRRVHHDSVDLPLRAIATYVALNAPDFDVLNFAALNRALVLVLADMLRVAVTDQDIEVESRRFRREHDLLDPEQLESWLRSNDITQVELRALVRERALCRRLHRWLLASRGDGQQTRLLLDELRLRGRYAQTAAAAAQECAAGRSVSLECESIAELSEAELVDLVPAQQRATSWRLHASMTDWAQEAGFRNLQDLAYELLRARRLRESRSNT
jgi:hypothetical protein